IERNLRLREYLPVGEMIPGMAYLVRRLLENTSNESWLRAGLSEQASDEVLLRSPHHSRDDASGDGRTVASSRSPHDALTAPDFHNEPPRDFADAPQRENFARAVAAARVETMASNATL